MNVVLHSTNCPKCNVLKVKLKQKEVEYVENNDVNVMLEKGIKSAPYLEVDDVLMNFNEAVKWVNEQ